MKNDYNKRLASRFIHKPSEYVFVHTKDGDFCACGHIIKTAYIVEHKSGHKLELGSECINNYAELNDVKAQVDAYLAKKKEEEKAHKAAEAEKEFLEALKRLAAIVDSVHDAMKRGKVSWDLYYDIRCMKHPWKKVKTVKTKVLKINALITSLEKTIIENNSYDAYAQVVVSTEVT